MPLCTNWQGAPLLNAMSDVFFVAAMYYYLRQNELVNREVSSRRAPACRHLLAVLRCPCVDHVLLTREDLPHVRVHHRPFVRKLSTLIKVALVWFCMSATLPFFLADRTNPSDAHHPAPIHAHSHLHSWARTHSWAGVANGVPRAIWCRRAVHLPHT